MSSEHTAAREQRELIARARGGRGPRAPPAARGARRAPRYDRAARVNRHRPIGGIARVRACRRRAIAYACAQVIAFVTSKTTSRTEDNRMGRRPHLNAVSRRRWVSGAVLAA